MGVATMVRLVKEREVQDRISRGDVPKAPGGAKSEEKAQSAVTSALERLTGFIPTEVVTGWGAAIGLLGPKKPQQTWGIFAAALAVMVILLLLESAVRDKQSGTSTAGSRKALLVLIAAVAFAVWAFALPGSPAAAQWGDDVMRVFGVVAVAVSAILYKLTQLLGLSPLEESTRTS